MVVLNIDDDSDDLEFFFKAVKTINPLAKCLLAHNPKEALHILKDTLLPDYIFLDLRMPRLDGKTVLTELRKFKKLRSVPVIMFSSEINPQEAAELQDLGASDFLKKPGNFNALCNALRGYLLKEK